MHSLRYPSVGRSKRQGPQLARWRLGTDQMADDSDNLPFLPADWRRSAEAIAHALGFAPPGQANEAKWTAILRNVEEAARLRGVTEMPPRWKEALARNVGRP